MSVHYQAVGWNRQKKIYDSWIAALVALYLALFIGITAVVHPSATIETLLIRAFGTGALLFLHAILCIGPLCRLDRRFLPLLFNRRHLGVTMFILALAHGVFSIVQFHAFGDIDPIASLLTTNTRWSSLARFPFQQLGAAALVILFVMAATSHDFWLKLLSPGTWKRLHMMVYLAYALLIAHVAFGALQSETSPVLVAVLVAGVALVTGLHVAAGVKEARFDRAVHVCRVDEIPEGRARVVTAGGERIAVFKHEGRISALSNVCKHQGGPLGEGHIVDGCVTCPWHGWHYLPDSGCSPPPFTEQVATYRTRVVDGQVLIELNH